MTNLFLAEQMDHIATGKTTHQGMLERGEKCLWVTDEAVNLTREKHDPCAQKVTYTKEENKNTLQKALVWSRQNTFRRLS